MRYSCSLQQLSCKRVFSDMMSVSGGLRVLEGPRDFLSVLSVFIEVLGRMVDYFELCDSRYIESHALLQDVDQIRSVSCTLQWGAGSARSNLSPVQIFRRSELFCCCCQQRYLHTCTVKPCYILTVKNALRTASQSAPFAILF